MCEHKAPVQIPQHVCKPFGLHMSKSQNVAIIPLVFSVLRPESLFVTPRGISNINVVTLFLMIVRRQSAHSNLKFGLWKM